MYGMGAETMSERLSEDTVSFPEGVQSAEAQKHIDRFYKQFPDVRKFFKAQKTEGNRLVTHHRAHHSTHHISRCEHMTRLPCVACLLCAVLLPVSLVCVCVSGLRVHTGWSLPLSA